VEKAQKIEQVESLKETLANAQSLVLTDFRGLTVGLDTQLRNELRKAGCEYRVVKNTLLNLAVKDTPMEVISDILKGPTAVAYHPEEPGTPAKVVAKFLKDESEAKLVVKGGYVDGQKLDDKGVDQLAKLPGKDEIRATFLATLMAAPQTFVRLTSAAQTNFLYLLQAKEREGAEG